MSKITKKEKFKALGRYLRRSRPSQGLLNLEDFGLCAADLTPRWLLAKAGRRGTSNYCLLQLITDRGFLGQIPVECLTPSVVLADRHFPVDREGYCYHRNFLRYCAWCGKYPKLPKQYKTLKYLVGRGIHPRRDDWTPLEAAAGSGHLKTFPLATIRPTDLNPSIVTGACIFRQIKLIAHLLRPDHIGGHVLVYGCFIENYFPPEIIQVLSAQSMLEDTYLGSALAFAVRGGFLRKISTKIFLNDYQAAKEAITKGIIDLKTRRRVPEKSLTQRTGAMRARKAVRWRVQLAQDILKR